MSFRVLDVSVHQDFINWTDAKEAGVQGVIIRAGYGSRLPSQVDQKVHNHTLAALAANMAVGFYHYSYATSIEGSNNEIDFFFDIISPYKNQTKFPVAYDLEDNTLIKAGLSKDDIATMAINFATRARSLGYTPMIYCNLNWARNYINMKRVHEAGIEFWNAQYNYYPQYSDGPIAMWQYSSKTHLPSYDKNLDSSWCTKDYTNGTISFRQNKQRGPNPKLEFRNNLDIDLGDIQPELGLAKLRTANEDSYYALSQHSVSIGTESFVVPFVQKRLKLLKFYDGEITGKADSATMHAINDFQSYYGLGRGTLQGTDWYYMVQP